MALDPVPLITPHSSQRRERLMPSGHLQMALHDASDAKMFLAGAQNHLDAGRASWTARYWARIAAFALDRLGKVVINDRDAAYRAEGEAARLAYITRREGGAR